MGMGGAYAAISDDASAIYWNPAGLTNLSRRQVLFMHAESFGGLVLHDYLGFVWPLGTARSSLGVGLLRLGVEDIPYTKLDALDHRPRVWKWVDDSESALFFSYARRGGEGWSFGGSAKILSLPMLKLGTAYKLSPQLLRGEILLALDADTRFEGRQYAAWASVGGVSLDPRVGLEYQYRHRIALRVGIQPGQFSAGAGIRLGLGGVDYAFLGHDDLDSSHRLSALVEF